MGWLFHHVGCFTYINEQGDLRVRPSYIDIRLEVLTRARRVKEHMCEAYRQAMTAVCCPSFLLAHRVPSKDSQAAVAHMETCAHARAHKHTLSLIVTPLSLSLPLCLSSSPSLPTLLPLFSLLCLSL